ncbi:MAG: hypothetical protein V4505_12965 [Pseudomonadota bacterium]
MAIKTPTNETTSKRVASIAAKVLANSNSSKTEKTIAGAALTQYVPPKKK